MKARYRQIFNEHKQYDPDHKGCVLCEMYAAVQGYELDDEEWRKRIAELEDLLARIKQACLDKPEVAEELFLGCLHDEILGTEGEVL